ncbi:MAG: hypothetical protein HY690_05635 [Chloroflexi bacterium]|nr:hypothetical protein [Chloroflexota bacterium]
MAFDYRLPRDLRARMALLPPQEEQELRDLLDRLLLDPEPDGQIRREVPPYFPFQPGTIETRLGKYRVAYCFVSPQNHAVIDILAISPLPPLERG